MNARCTEAQSKRTPWYPGDVHPARNGLYERDHTLSRFGAGRYPVRFSYWDGERWGGWSIYRWSAFHNKVDASWEQSLPWRGLSEKPSRSPQTHSK